MEKISVLVPIYNQEKYLRRCIESIINQTYTNLEIILIDDGSEDKSYEIIEEYTNKDKRIKGLKIKNNGVADARNKAIDNVTGEYFSFIDSDDFVAEDYIETLYNNLKKYGADIAICNCMNITENTNNVIHKDFGIKEIKEYSNIEAVESLFYYNFLRHSPWGKLYNTKLWKNIRFPIGKNYEDLATIYKIFLNAKKIIYIPEEKYNYIIRNGSIIHSEIRQKDIEAILEYSEDILNYIGKNYKELLPAAEYLLADHELHLWYRVNKNKQNTEYLNIATENVKKYRKGVLKNPKVTRKSKVLFLVSYLGRRIYKTFVTLYKKMG